MDYTTIFDPVPWQAIGHTILQTLTLYWLLLLGIKAIGRRIFGEMGPQDLIILLLIAEACDLGLADERAGYWGTIASVLTILATGAMVERVPSLRRALESKAVVLFEDGSLRRGAMKKCLVDEEDLERVAREYGLASYEDFERMMLEGDGGITGVLRSELRGPRRRLETPGVG